MDAEQMQAADDDARTVASEACVGPAAEAEAVPLAKMEAGPLPEVEVAVEAEA